MIPDIDRAKMADDVMAWLKEAGLSYREACARHPGLNPAMVSRAARADIMSAASILTICAVMGKDPMRYLIFLDHSQRNQTVTRFGKRETREART